MQNWSPFAPESESHSYQGSHHVGGGEEKGEEKEQEQEQELEEQEQKLELDQEQERVETFCVHDSHPYSSRSFASNTQCFRTGFRPSSSHFCLCPCSAGQARKQKSNSFVQEVVVARAGGGDRGGSGAVASKNARNGAGGKILNFKFSEIEARSEKNRGCSISNT
jgi:hypothetical protein